MIEPTTPQKVIMEGTNNGIVSGKVYWFIPAPSDDFRCDNCGFRFGTDLDLPGEEGYPVLILHPTRQEVSHCPACNHPLRIDTEKPTYIFRAMNLNLDQDYADIHISTLSEFSSTDVEKHFVQAEDEADEAAREDPYGDSILGRLMRGDEDNEEEDDDEEDDEEDENYGGDDVDGEK